MIRITIMAIISSSLTACNCGGEGFQTFGDAGEPDAGPGPGPEPPAPPVFPLKEGDVLELPSVGGRIEPCGGATGDCDRVVSASYTIQDVFQEEETGHWVVNAEYLYTFEKNNTSFEAISRLFISRTVPLDTLMAESESSSGNADFTTNAAPSDQITANGFPFFHYEAAYANESGSAYQQAAANFAVRITTIDPQADINNVSAAQKIEAYFKDNLGANTYLHKVTITLHTFGFICLWDEKMVTWSDGMERNNSALSNTDVPLVGNIFPPSVIRDDVRYICFCSSNNCEATVDGVKQCLDFSDPDAEPSEENCN